MAKIEVRVSTGISRRVVLFNGVACAAGFATAVAANTQAFAAKLPQKSVAYRPTPNGDKKCSNCVLFEPPDACKNVEGTVSPDGFCILWKKA